MGAIHTSTSHLTFSFSTAPCPIPWMLHGAFPSGSPSAQPGLAAHKQLPTPLPGLVPFGQLRIPLIFQAQTWHIGQPMEPVLSMAGQCPNTPQGRAWLKKVPSPPRPHRGAWLHPEHHPGSLTLVLPLMQEAGCWGHPDAPHHALAWLRQRIPVGAHPNPWAWQWFRARLAEGAGGGPALQGLSLLSCRCL